MSAHRISTALEARVRALLVALLLLCNLAPALAAPPTVVGLGAADGCTLAAVATDCCCDPAPQAAACCAPVDSCGCTTVPTRPATEGMTPDALLAPGTARGFELQAELERAAARPAAVAPCVVDAGSATLADATPPGVPRLEPPGDTAGRLGIQRGTGARLAFLATLLS